MKSFIWLGVKEGSIFAQVSFLSYVPIIAIVGIYMDDKRDTRGYNYKNQGVKWIRFLTPIKSKNFYKREEIDNKLFKILL